MNERVTAQMEGVNAVIDELRRGMEDTTQFTVTEYLVMEAALEICEMVAKRLAAGRT